MVFSPNLKYSISANKDINGKGIPRYRSRMAQISSPYIALSSDMRSYECAKKFEQNALQQVQSVSGQKLILTKIFHLKGHPKKSRLPNFSFTIIIITPSIQ